MAVICRKCGKTVSEKVNACYNCGELLAPPLKCTGCGRENVANRTQCQYCGVALAAPADAVAPAPAAAASAAPALSAAPPPTRSGGTRLSFEDEAPPPKKSPPPSAAIPPPSQRSMPAPPPAKPFEVIQAPVGSQNLMTPAEYIDIALLVLAAPAAVWGMMVLLGVIMLTMMRGGPGMSSFTSRLANPSWWAFIPPALIGAGVAYLIQAWSTPQSGFWTRHAFTVTCTSCVFGLILLIRRMLRNRPRRRSTANDLFRP